MFIGYINVVALRGQTVYAYLLQSNGNCLLLKFSMNSILDVSVSHSIAVADSKSVCINESLPIGVGFR